MATESDVPEFEQMRSPRSGRKIHHASPRTGARMTSSKTSHLRPIRVRIVLAGSEKTGKSCLIKRYCEKRFVSKYLATIGIDYGATKIYVDKREVSVHIFDTSGNAVFRDIRNEFYLDAHGILLVYDVTRRDTFYSLSKWLHEIRSELLQRGSGEDIVGENPSKTVVICANKVDALQAGGSDSGALDDNLEEARLWADLHGFPFCETSAATGQGVGEMFQTFFAHIVKQQLENSPTGTMPRTPATARRVHLAQSPSASTMTSPSTLPRATSTPRESLYPASPSPEQSAVLKLLRSGHYEQLFPPGANRDEINRIYRKLAILLHPDKTALPGADEAFKILGVARRNLLATCNS